MTDADRLPSAIAQFFEASNADDRDRFLAAFAEDAVLDDWGHTFTGREQIAAWNESDNIGVGSRFTVEGFTEHDGVYAVSIQVRGGGYNGGGVMAFALNPDGLISRVDITG